MYTCKSMYMYRKNVNAYISKISLTKLSIASIKGYISSRVGGYFLRAAVGGYPRCGSSMSSV